MTVAGSGLPAGVAALRAALDPAIEVGRDANQGFGLEEARRLLGHASPAITFLDQPTPHDRRELISPRRRT